MCAEEQDQGKADGEEEQKVNGGGGGQEEAKSKDKDNKEGGRTRTKKKDKGLLVYSSKDLKKLRQKKVSNKWPSFLDADFKNSRGVWDPDRWHQGRRRGSTPPPKEAGGGKEAEAGGEAKKDSKGIDIKVTVLFSLFDIDY